MLPEPFSLEHEVLVFGKGRENVCSSGYVLYHKYEKEMLLVTTHTLLGLFGHHPFPLSVWNTVVLSRDRCSIHL